MNQLVIRRLVPILTVSMFLILVFGVLQYNGLWPDTSEAVTRIGLPAVMGSFQFNLINLVFVALAVYLASNKNFQQGFGAFLTAGVILIATLSIPFGLVLGFATAVFLTLMGILTLFLVSLLMTINEPVLIKRFKKYLQNTFWPTE